MSIAVLRPFTCENKRVAHTFERLKKQVLSSANDSKIVPYDREAGRVENDSVDSSNVDDRDRDHVANSEASGIGYDSDKSLSQYYESDLFLDYPVTIDRIP